MESLVDKKSISKQGHLERYYGIGDNPYSDIQGANNAGKNWTSILVRTGIFQGSNHHEHPADIVCDNVEDAVNWILKKEAI